MKQYHFGLVGKDRKALVAAVSDLLGIPSKYCASPNYEYQIGDYEVTREGTLVGPEDISLMAWLADKGFEVAKDEAQPETDSCQETVTEPEANPTAAIEPETNAAAAEPETGPEAATEPDPDPEAVAEQDTIPEAVTEPDTRLEVATEPEANVAAAEPDTTPDAVTETEVDTPRTESSSKQENTAEVKPKLETQTEPEAMTLTIDYPREGMSDEAVSNLRKMVSAKEPLLKMALGVDELPILLGDEIISFPWFMGNIDGESATGYAKIIACLCESAKRKRRVSAQIVQMDNPRFCCRTWLTSLGMVGKEFDISRKLLCGKLPGDSGHRFSGHDTMTARKRNADGRRPAKQPVVSEEARAQILDMREKGIVKMLNIHDIGELAKENGYHELVKLVQTDPIGYVSFILASLL